MMSVNLSRQCNSYKRMCTQQQSLKILEAKTDSIEEIVNSTVIVETAILHFQN